MMMMMILFIEILEYGDDDDVTDWKIRVWWWWWSKDQSIVDDVSQSIVDDDVSDWKRLKCWCCKGSEDRSASTKDRNIKALLQKDQVIIWCRRWRH